MSERKGSLNSNNTNTLSHRNKRTASVGALSRKAGGVIGPTIVFPFSRSHFAHTCTIMADADRSTWSEASKTRPPSPTCTLRVDTLAAELITTRSRAKLEGRQLWKKFPPPPQCFATTQTYSDSPLVLRYSTHNHYKPYLLIRQS